MSKLWKNPRGDDDGHDFGNQMRRQEDEYVERVEDGGDDGVSVALRRADGRMCSSQVSWELRPSFHHRLSLDLSLSWYPPDHHAIDLIDGDDVG